VCYAAHRQDRTFRPASEYCPFCPTRANGVAKEIPFSDFEVAVFENRFPAFLLESHLSPELLIPTAPAIGKCEIIVYSANHNDSWSSLSQSRLELIVNVWQDRYQDLLQHEQVQFVMPFENKGEEIGASLTHPHGQIFAFSYIPPVVEKMATGFREKPVLQDLRQIEQEQYEIFIDDFVIAYVPPFQRYPYELWLTTHQFHPGLWEFSKQETSSFARTIGMIFKLYDGLFDKPMPYIMLLYASPKGAEKYFQFHAQFLPFLRNSDKMKYLAGCETGARLLNLHQTRHAYFMQQIP